MRKYLEMSLDDNPPLQPFEEHADFFAGTHLALAVNREYLC
jgi:hypothetical protein